MPLLPMPSLPSILPYSNSTHWAQVIALWESFLGYTTPHNRPEFVIDKKIQNDDGLFFVATVNEAVVGTVMAGYDGHRGWLYSLAVEPGHQRRKIGSTLVSHAERELAKLGCVKVNLQIMAGNEDVIGFYTALGFSVEERISMGKLITENVPPGS
jgi:ribosomal protein S18 acetylase RimI-like enzyme